MKNAIIIAVIAIACFLLGTLMPREPKVVETVVTEMIRDTIIHTQIKSVPIYTEHRDTEYVYINTHHTDTLFVNDTVYIALPREYYFAETDDCMIWHSGIDSRIDSLVNFRETKIIQAEKWSRHTLNLYGSVGVGTMEVGAEYEFGVFKWMAINASAGYDFYLKQPNVSAGINLTVYSW